MKKFISIALLLAVLLSCCACGKKAEETESLQFPTLEEVLAQMEAEEKAKQADPEELYGMIDQTVPVNGVYKIWNAEGVKLMADHPDADFEFLCSIDMEGATVRAIGTKDQPFTGNIDGMNNSLSNFTVEATDDGYLGFLGYSEGKIGSIKLENVTYVAKENTKYMGGIAGYSTKNLRDCTAKGIMNVTAAADGAVVGGMVGQIDGDIVNSVADVDITYTAAGSATIGGLAGIMENGKSEFTETYGFLDITGSNKKTGLIFGQAKAVSLYTVSYLGEKNQVDGKLFSNYFGSDEEVTYEVINVRDNTPRVLPENVQKLRDRVVEEMNTMGTVEWYTTQDLYHDCACLLTICHGIFEPNKLHVGIPYNHKGSSLARFNYCRDEETGAMKDWVYGYETSYDGYDCYFGNDCSSAIQQAWWTVSNSTDLIRCTYMHPKYAEQNGCLPVGEYNWEEGIDEKGKAYTGDYTDPYTVASGMQTMYEAYAQMHKGDAYAHKSKDGGHTRMAVEEPVIVRNEKGEIDGKYSYVVSTEQGGPNITEPYYCSWNVNATYTFQQLFDRGYIPVTCEELITGEMEPVEVKIEGDLEGKIGMVSGKVTSNYFLDGAVLQIVDAEGNEVLDHTIFPSVDRYLDGNCSDSGIRNYNDQFDMSRFTSILQTVQFEIGETYSYTVTVRLTTGDDVVVKTGSFTNGQA